MARSPIFPLRLDPTRRVAWEAGAKEAGQPLAEFVRESVDRRLTVAAAVLPEPTGKRVAVTKGFGVTGPARQAKAFSKEQQTGKGSR
jgi:hypothetical protein